MKKNDLISALNDIPGNPPVLNGNDAELAHVELAEADGDQGTEDVVILTFEDE